MRISEILKQIDSEDVNLIKDAEISGTELCSNIRFDNALTFTAKENFLPCLDVEHPLSVICSEKLIEKLPKGLAGIVVSANPKYTFFLIHNFLAKKTAKRIPTVIGRNCIFEENSVVAKYNVVIGNNVIVEAGVIIREGVKISDDCVIGAGTVIGGRSFSSVRHNEKTINLVDCGSVTLGKGVQICSNCHIARGTLKKDSTVLDDYCRLDAMVHVGHGTRIGKRTFVTAGVMLSGNTVIGDDVWLGVNATVSNRLTLGDKSRVSLGSVVTKDLPEGMTVTGNFAIDHQVFLRNLKKSVSEGE